MASKKRPLPEATRELQAKKLRLVKEPLYPWRVFVCSIETTKRNAMDSPLLRLPSEIRNKIWEYASNGDVEIHEHAGCGPFIRKHDALPAFHLPRVCRQVYGETAILAYSLSTFAFPCRFKCKACVEDKAFTQWNLQKNSDVITAIETNAKYIQEYTLLENIAEIRGFPLYGDKVQLRKTYPSLRCIYISKSVVKYSAETWAWTRNSGLLGLLEPGNLKQWKGFIEGAIKNIEGKDMEVIFKD